MQRKKQRDNLNYTQHMNQKPASFHGAYSVEFDREQIKLPTETSGVLDTAKNGNRSTIHAQVNEFS